jgi:hypothetical protein
MGELQFVAKEGPAIIRETAAVDELRATLHGPLLCAENKGYDEARRVWNGLTFSSRASSRR